jgi:hypothetical protein
MPKFSPLVVTASCGLCAALALAQEASPSAAPSVAVPDSEKIAETSKPTERSTTEHTNPKPAPTPKPAPGSDSPVSAQAPVPEVVATPKPKKPNFFQRLFGSRKKKDATATPAPTGTPSSTPSGRRVVRRVIITPTPKPEAATPTPKTAKVTPTPKPEMVKVVPTGKSTPTPGVTAKATPAVTAKAPTTTPTPKAPTATPVKKSTTVKAPVEPPAGADPEEQEKFRYEQAKAKASEDPHVKGLKAKADDATTDEESRKALRAYNKALFDKIRKIDSSVADRADRMEAAILRRLGE